MDANQIIDALGGTTKVAQLCEITEGAVSQWRSSNHIPPARRLYLKAIRPDVFSALDESYTGPERRTGEEPGNITLDQRKRAA